MAKKSKVVKKALAKKAAPKKAAPKKAAAKPAASKVKKAAPKKPVAKKAIAKKVVKKAPVKKTAPKKVAVKKPVAKKAIAIKKPVSVKPVPVKAAVKPALPARKKVVAKKKIVPVAAPIQLPDATVENAANINNQMMVPGDGLNAAPVITEDPVKTFDKNVFNKATSKGDPHSNRQLSSKPKNTIKPSGKKPLW